MKCGKRKNCNKFCLCAFLQHEAALIYDAVYMFAHALELYDKKSFFHLPNASCNFPSKWSQGENLYTYLNQVTMSHVHNVCTVYFCVPQIHINNYNNGYLIMVNNNVNNG